MHKYHAFRPLLWPDADASSRCAQELSFLLQSVHNSVVFQCLARSLFAAHGEESQDLFSSPFGGSLHRRSLAVLDMWWGEPNLWGNSPEKGERDVPLCLTSKMRGHVQGRVCDPGTVDVGVSHRQVTLGEWGVGSKALWDAGGLINSLLYFSGKDKCDMQYCALKHFSVIPVSSRVIFAVVQVDL